MVVSACCRAQNRPRALTTPKRLTAVLRGHTRRHGLAEGTSQADTGIDPIAVSRAAMEVLEPERLARFAAADRCLRDVSFLEIEVIRLEIKGE